MQSITDKIASRQAHLLVEMTTFNEEQSIRRLLGPASFNELCSEIEAECERINRSGVGQFRCDKVPLALTVRNQSTGKVLKVRYDSASAGIQYECEETGAILFRVNKLDTPSVVPVFHDTSYRPQELASVLLTDLL